MRNPHVDCAAQYLRMSSEVQDLSVSVQESAIGAHCAANKLTLVATYKDEARSGLDLRGRPELRRLLNDVAAPDCPFSVILVFDVSRWGRFQDTDESAYWDFHCSLHGVRVVYVNEPFDQEPSPLTTLIKSLKRAMAAEYSRELGIKTRAGQDRAIDLGFHMGTLPSIGLRRIAVSKDPGRTRELLARERKGNQSEHIRWVPGPDPEVAAVRRIFDLYGRKGMHMRAIAELLNSEDLRPLSGVPFSVTMVRGILDCEAFIGNFVWSRTNSTTQRRRTETDPLFRRTVGTIEPILDVEVWHAVQSRRFWKRGQIRSRSRLLGELRVALAGNPSVTALELASAGCAAPTTYAKVFGSMEEAFSLAGRDKERARDRKVERQVRGWRVVRSLVHDLEVLFTESGILWTRPLRQHTFVLAADLRLRVQLMWELEHHGTSQWFLGKSHWSHVCDHILVARMCRNETAQDFLLLSKVAYRAAPPWLREGMFAGVVPLRNACELVNALNALVRNHQLTPIEGRGR